MKKIFKTENSKDTFLLGKKISTFLKKGHIIDIKGDLGVGKTQIAKGIIKGLGINDLVTSPTFNLMNIYKKKYNVYHIDGYRLKSLEEAYQSGIQEAFKEDGIVIVEWGEKISYLYSEEIIKINIIKTSDKKRKIIIIGLEF